MKFLAIISIVLISFKSLFALDVDFIKSITYKLEITKNGGEKGYATAIAVSQDGKLVTAYHNINSYNKIVAIDSSNRHFSIKVSTISLSNDLAFLYLIFKDAKIPYAMIDTKKPKIGDNVYIYNSSKQLFIGSISKIKDNQIVYDFKISKGTSGAGVFTRNAKLTAIALGNDLINTTSYGVPVSMFKHVKDKYLAKKILALHDSGNYDYSFCEDKDELAIWAKLAKSTNMKTQELHALFLGLCKKVKNHDLTTDEAQIIFENSRNRLLDL